MTRFHRFFGFGLGLALVVGCSSSGDDNTQGGDTGTPPSDSAVGDTYVFDSGAPPDVTLDVPTDVGDIGNPETSDGACGGTTITATARDVSTLLVLDKSGSMNDKPPGYTVTKWSAMKTALSGSLAKVKSRMSLGLELFPYDTAASIGNPCAGNCCSVPTGGAAINVPIEAGSTAVDKIITAVSASSPGGATPTAEALKRALDYFTTGAGKDLKGDKYVILATDGGPNCNAALTCDAAHCTKNLDGFCSTPMSDAGVDDADATDSAVRNCCDTTAGGSKIDCVDDGSVIAQLNALKTAGVKTFVIGIPGSEAYNGFLDTFAEAGGISSPSTPPKYFAVGAAGDVGGLEATFDLITGSLITTCKLVLTSEPADPNKLNVFVDGKEIPQGGPDGWDLDTTTHPPTITLKGATCGAMTSKGAKIVEISYGCPTIK